MSEVKKGVTIWLTGLPSSGKSTVAHALSRELKARGLPVEILDGDVIRTHLSQGLGFSREDRDLNVKRIGFVSHLLTKYGVFVIVAAVSPYREARDWCRRQIGSFVEVFVETPVAVCEERDVKGLYRKARAGEIQGFTGVDDAYEEPLRPEVKVQTTVENVDESVAKIVSRLEELGYLQQRPIKSS